MANKGEWSEPYAALKILGDGKLCLTDELANDADNDTFMLVDKITRYENLNKKRRTVSYVINGVNVDILVDEQKILTVPANDIKEYAKKLANQIQLAKSNSIDISNDIKDFLKLIELKKIKASSVNKSDIFMDVRDPRSGTRRENIGFSIKSDFGHDPTLFNTAKASAFIYKLSNMTDSEMNYINSLFDKRGHVSVTDRCDQLIKRGHTLTFVGLPIAKKAKCKAFQENLDLINPRLITVIERILWNHFINHDSEVNLAPLTEKIIAENPCKVTLPEIKYPYMIKAFIYATYCGLTASTVWDGKSDVNGGLIRVSRAGEVQAYYALESDGFKTYLFDNCYFEFPSTDEKHGNYARVYKENSEYFFRLNFQIRYR